MSAQVFSTLLQAVLCTNTAWNIHQTMKRFVKCFFELLTQIFHSVPWERSGRGTEPPQNLPTTAGVVQTVLSLEWS